MLIRYGRSTELSSQTQGELSLAADDGYRKVSIFDAVVVVEL